MLKQPHPAGAGRVRYVCATWSIESVRVDLHAKITVQTNIGPCGHVPHPRNPPHGQFPNPRVKRSCRIPRGLPGSRGMEYPGPGHAIDRCIKSTAQPNTARNHHWFLSEVPMRALFRVTEHEGLHLYLFALLKCLSYDLSKQDLKRRV